MNNQFPMVTAIQCIPEFHGKSEELDPFIIQIEYFARGIPEGTAHEPLLNVVYLKLKGKALLRLPYLKGTTWPIVKQKLKDEFELKKNIGEIIREIETLAQSREESFDEYKTRAETLFQWVEAINENEKESYAKATLRRHFLGGLRNTALAQAGKTQREGTFPDLLKWLKRECEEGDEIREIHSRVHNTYTTGPNQRYNSIKQSGTGLKIDEIIHQVETLEQGENETFKCYKDRTLKLREYIEELEVNEDKKSSFAEQFIKIHFLEGLKDKNLKDFVRTLHKTTFTKLLDVLDYHNQFERSDDNFSTHVRFNENSVRDVEFEQNDESSDGLRYDTQDASFRRATDQNYNRHGSYWQNTQMCEDGVEHFNSNNGSFYMNGNRHDRLNNGHVFGVFERPVHKKIRSRNSSEWHSNISKSSKYNNMEFKERINDSKRYDMEVKNDECPQILQKINFTRSKQLRIRLASSKAPFKKISYLLDTGAYPNLLRKDIAALIGVEKINYDDGIIITNANGGKMKTIGSTWVDLIIGNETFPIKFQIVKDLLVPGIIGIEFLREHIVHISRRFDYAIFQRFANHQKAKNIDFVGNNARNSPFKNGGGMSSQKNFHYFVNNVEYNNKNHDGKNYPSSRNTELRRYGNKPNRVVVFKEDSDYTKLIKFESNKTQR